MRDLEVRIHLGIQKTVRRAQVAGEPSDHDRDTLEIPARALQIIERGLDVGGRVRGVTVLRRELPRPHQPHDRARLIAELGGAGDQRHGAHHLLEPPDRADQLER